MGQELGKCSIDPSFRRCAHSPGMKMKLLISASNWKDPYYITDPPIDHNPPEKHRLVFVLLFLPLSLPAAFPLPNREQLNGQLRGSFGLPGAPNAARGRPIPTELAELSKVYVMSPIFHLSVSTLNASTVASILTLRTANFVRRAEGPRGLVYKPDLPYTATTQHVRRPIHDVEEDEFDLLVCDLHFFK